MMPLLEILNLTRWEWFRLSRRAGALVLFALTLLLAASVMVLAVAQNLGAFPFPGEPGYFAVAAVALSVLSPFLAVLLAAQVHALDLQGGNCRTLAARGAARPVILAAKALTCALALLAFHLILLLLAALLSAFFPPHVQDLRAGLADIGASCLISLLYLSLGIALAHWRQSTAFTVGVGISLIFFEAVAYPIANGIGDLVDWPVSQVTAWTLWGVANGLQGDGDLLTRPWFISIIAAYTSALLTLALLTFQNQDLPPGPN